MKQSELQNLIRQEIKKSLKEELDHTYEGIEDSILQGIADWTNTKKSEVFKMLTPAAAKALHILVTELKPTLDKKQK
jgi:hypothetical protein